MVVRVFLVDDQTLFRKGLRALLAGTPGIEIVGEAGDGQECLRLASISKPDVVLMDLRMPGMDGVEATRRLQQCLPSARVIALTTFDDDALVFDVLREGALSYLLKDCPVEDIALAIHAAMEGRSVLASGVAGKVVSEFARMARLTTRPEIDELGVSKRELEVLRLVARGASNKEIAAALGIAEGTVKNHLTGIFAKLGVEDRTQAALLARAHGVA